MPLYSFQIYNISDALFQTYWSKLSSNVLPYFNLLVHVYSTVYRRLVEEDWRDSRWLQRGQSWLFKNFFDPSLPNRSKLVFLQERLSLSETENYNPTRLFLAQRSLRVSLPQNIGQVLETIIDDLRQTSSTFSFLSLWVPSYTLKK